MTDAAFAADVTPSPAPSGVPLDPNQVQIPNPAESTLPQAEQPPAKPAEAKADIPKEATAKTPGEAVKRAMDKVKAKEAGKEADKPVEAVKGAETPAEPGKEPQPRGEKGQFAPREAAQQQAAAVEGESKYPDAPSRFSNDGKAAWREAPEPVRAEVHRALGELERGYEKHKADAEAFADIKPFADLAKQTGTTLKQAMSNYVGIEQLLRRDLLGGMDKIANQAGTSLRDIAAHVLGQTPDQNASKQDATIRQLNQKIDQLTGQLNSVAQSVQSQRTESTVSQVESFAAQPGHERFEELAQDIEFFLKSGRAKDLAEAYSLAERLNPAPGKPAASPPGIQATERPPVNPAGTKSIAGSPSPGSTPSGRPEPVPDTLTALKRAAARARA